MEAPRIIEPQKYKAGEAIYGYCPNDNSLTQNGVIIEHVTEKHIYYRLFSKNMTSKACDLTAVSEATTDSFDSVLDETFERMPFDPFLNKTRYKTKVKNIITA